MSEEDEDFDEPGEQFYNKKRTLTRNQKIYGDFYEPSGREESISSKKVSHDGYSYFKAGQTIENYVAEVEVDIPIKKRVEKDYLQLDEENDDQKPMIGSFNLNSFLGMQRGLEDIQEEDSENQPRPEGLNPAIKHTLQLVQIGHETEDQIQNLQEMDLQKYLKMHQPHNQKKPKYRTQEEKILAKEFNQGYGVGFKMLQKMGFNVTKGLGKNQTGMNRPVEALAKSAFTARDQDDQANKSEDEEISESEEKEQISEKLFSFRSRNYEINKFLNELKNQYEGLSTKTHFYHHSIQSFQREQELSQSLALLKQAELQQLKKETALLQSACQALSSQVLTLNNVGIDYEIDKFYVKHCYESLMNINDLSQLQQLCPLKLDALQKQLHHIYLQKEKSKVKEFQQITAFQQKMEKEGYFFAHPSAVINLETGSDSELEQLYLSDETKTKMDLYFELIIEKVLANMSEVVEGKSKSLMSILCNEKLMGVVETLSKYDGVKGTVLGFLRRKIKPLMEEYLGTFSFGDLEQNKTKMFPHMVVFPWLNLLPIAEVNLIRFYQRLVSQKWPPNLTLLTILTPFIKFSSKLEKHFLFQLYLFPRLLYQMESFSLYANQEGSNDSNKQLLATFIKYSQLLPKEITHDILENTILIEILKVYQTYQKENIMEHKELQKWLALWKKTIDKISASSFEMFFRSYSIKV